MIPGIDALGAPKYRKAFLTIPRHFAVRSFGETFGDFYPLAKDWVRTGGLLLGVDLLWNDDHKYGSSAQMKRVKKMALQYQQLAVEFPEVDLEISPFTEHNLSNPDKYLDDVQLWAPDCTIVNNPWKGAFSRRYKNEVHGSKGAPNGRYNYSGDGGLDSKPYNAELVDCDFQALLKEHANCERFYFWHVRNNGKYSMKDPAKRPQRKYWPSPDFLASQYWYFTDPGQVQLPKGWFVKSHAELHGANDNKGDKLLIVSPIKTSEITLKRNGKVVGRLRYFGSFDGGGYRYYSSTLGYKHGSDCEVFIKNKKYGKINAGMRTKPFRGKI